MHFQRNVLLFWCISQIEHRKDEGFLLFEQVFRRKNEKKRFVKCNKMSKCKPWLTIGGALGCKIREKIVSLHAN